MTLSTSTAAQQAGPRQRRRLSWEEVQRRRQGSRFQRLLEHSLRFRLLMAATGAGLLLGAVNRWEHCRSHHFESGCVLADPGGIVTVDNVEGTRIGVAHLLQLGHRDVALLGGPLRHSTATERRQGYELALREAGRAIRADLIYNGDFREGGGYEGMNALLALPRRPTAVFVANNLMTLGAFRALHEAGVRIPEEVAVVGFDDMPWATSLNPPLTAMSQPSQEIGSSAADLLLDRIARPDRAIRHLILETKLVVRASCGASLHRARPKASPGTHGSRK